MLLLIVKIDRPSCFNHVSFANFASRQAPIEVPASSDKCLAHWPWMFTPKISLRSSRRNRLIVVTGMFVWGSELILPRMTQWIVFFSEASKVQ
ncbi:hypothetical protein V6N13_094255 [Hibiscus sabdariffa]